MTEKKDFKLDANYVTVAERIVEFREKYQEGSLQPLDLTRPYTIELINGNQCFVVVAAAYRTPMDPRPGVGMAYEPIPGSTPYTRGSELQNAETAAWGRAIVAVLAADTTKGIASHEEVTARQQEIQTIVIANADNLAGYESWFDAIEERSKLPDAYEQLLALYNEGTVNKIPKAVLIAISTAGEKIKVKDPSIKKLAGK